MNLTTYTNSNSRTRFVKCPESHMRFNSKTGMVRFNAQAIKLLGLETGMQVQIHQREDDCQWLLEIVKHDGLLIRIQPGDCAYFNNRFISRQVADSFEIDHGQSIRVEIEKIPVEEDGRYFYELNYYK